MALIRGTRHDDTLYASDGDRVNAFAGNDEVHLSGGENTVHLGRGNDAVYGWGQSGQVWGGVGDDTLYWWGSGTAVGGKGNDAIYAFDTGAIFGDEGPGLASRTAGNDFMFTLATSAGGDGTQTGGQGADWHFFNAHQDGLGGASHLTITDFTAGQDKVGMALSYATPEGVGAGYLASTSIWSILDTNADGVLNGTDAPLDANSGTAVVDGSLHLRLHDDEIIVAHTTAITAADWLFV